MRNRTVRIAIAALAVSGLLLAAFLHFGAGASTSNVKAAFAYSTLTPLQKRLISGFAANNLDPQNTANAKTRLTYYPDHGDDQCAKQLGSNIKVNQNCLNLTDTNLQGRGQANNETAIAVNPNNAQDLVASNNDYRRGDGNCYGAYTLNNANQWNDTTIPMGFTNGKNFGGVTRQYWQAGGDTSVAWDTKGNAYLSCQVFMRGPGVTNNPDQSSAFYVFRSTHNNGASWNFPGRPVAESYTATGSPFLDKQYMTVDNHVGSPFQDRVYVTWTTFAANGTANIYEAYSNDYAEHFSTPVLVSTTSSLCPNVVPGDAANSCDANQYSDPFTGSDGALYVVYANFNNSQSTTTDNHNQFLLSKSTDGGNTFSAPVLVANYNDLPDCATYQAGQDPGRACVPEKGSATNSVFRATNYPSGLVNPRNAQQVVVTFGSYINKDSKPSNGCVPAGLAGDGNNLYTGVKTAGACNNKILESISTNGGTSFNGTVTDPTTLTIVSSAAGQRLTDQWFQWSAFTTSGKLAVSYYDRQYGSDETTGNMDFSLSGSVNNSTKFNVARVTSSSMPLPTEFPDSQGNSVFFGDYTGLAASATFAYPIWSDTRDKDLALCPGTGMPGVPPQVCTFTAGSNGIQANDEDVYMARVAVH
ncbi:MAG: sialidase family protein [Ktedonobacteraceae bacterium]